MSLLLSILLILTGAFTLTPNTEYYVTASSCYLYEDASFDSNKIKQDGEDFVVSHGQAVIMENESGDFCLVTIKNLDISGYIYKYYLTEKSAVSYHPVFNATIRETTEVYDMNYNQTEFSVQKDQRVYLYKGFNSKGKYTAVQIVLEDGSVYNGYVLSEKIKPDGVSRTLIIAIPLISATVIVILSVVLIRKNKKKKVKIGSKS